MPATLSLTQRALDNTAWQDEDEIIDPLDDVEEES